MNYATTPVRAIPYITDDTAMADVPAVLRLLAERVEHLLTEAG